MALNGTGVVDSDGDNLSDNSELQIGTNPNNADTDADGVNDGREVDQGTDPKDPDDAAAPELDPPGKSEVIPDSLIDKSRPTIILTHGWQKEDDKEDTLGNLWIGSESKQATNLILTHVFTQQFNIVRYVWEDAFTGKGKIPARFDYVRARVKADNAGVALANNLISLLGDDYDQPVHFIGHSLGTIVNAYAANLFLKHVKSVSQAQFTILDFPHYVNNIPLGSNPDTPEGISNRLQCAYKTRFLGPKNYICTDKFEEKYGFPKTFFASLFHNLRPTGQFAIDNYYAKDGKPNPPKDLNAGVGTKAKGPIYNHAIHPEGLKDPWHVGDMYFNNEDTFLSLDNNHTGVHQWYRWSMAPNDISFAVEGPFACDVNNNFINPFNFDGSESLDPCRAGAYWSLIRPDNAPFPFDKIEKQVFNIDKVNLTLENIKPHGCTGTLVITCREQSSPFLIGEVNIPEDAEYISFDYRFIYVGDGDYAAVFIDDVPIWTLAGSNFFGNDFLDSGAIPISGFTGARKLTIALYGVNEPNAEFEIQNFRTFDANLVGDLDNDGDVDKNDLNILLSARNTPATGPDDPRDLDGDGMITALDGRKLMLLCTRTRCAIE